MRRRRTSTLCPGLSFRSTPSFENKFSHFQWAYNTDGRTAATFAHHRNCYRHHFVLGVCVCVCVWNREFLFSHIHKRKWLWLKYFVCRPFFIVCECSPFGWGIASSILKLKTQWFGGESSLFDIGRSWMQLTATQCPWCSLIPLHCFFFYNSLPTFCFASLSDFNMTSQRNTCIIYWHICV